jgi:hypothetical protein
VRRLLGISEATIQTIVEEGDTDGNANARYNREQQQTWAIVRIWMCRGDREIENAQVGTRLRFRERHFLVAGFQHAVEIFARGNLPCEPGFLYRARWNCPQLERLGLQARVEALLARPEGLKNTLNDLRNRFVLQRSDGLVELFDSRVGIRQELFFSAERSLARRQFVECGAKLRRVGQNRRDHQKRLRVDRTASRIGDHLLERNPLTLHITQRALLREVAAGRWIGPLGSGTSRSSGGQRDRADSEAFQLRFGRSELALCDGHLITKDLLELQ